MSESSNKIEIREAENKARILDFYGEFNQSKASDFASFLINNALEKEDLIIDFSNVEEIDISGVQLLASVMMERNKNKYKTEYYITDNEEVLEFCNKTGISELFNKLTKKG